MTKPTTTRDLRGVLEDYSGEYPTSWRLRPGSILIGTLLRYDRAVSVHGPRWERISRFKRARC